MKGNVMLKSSAQLLTTGRNAAMNDDSVEAIIRLTADEGPYVIIRAPRLLLAPKKGPGAVACGNGEGAPTRRKRVETVEVEEDTDKDGKYDKKTTTRSEDTGNDGSIEVTVTTVEEGGDGAGNFKKRTTTTEDKDASGNPRKVTTIEEDRDGDGVYETKRPTVRITRIDRDSDGTPDATVRETDSNNDGIYESRVQTNDI
jgi:hypothetical protein